MNRIEGDEKIEKERHTSEMRGMSREREMRRARDER